MFEIAFGGFDEIRDQVIATLELDINLRKRVFESVAQSDQSVVDPHDPRPQDDKDQQYAETVSKPVMMIPRGQNLFPT